jgi:hypothetical protein
MERILVINRMIEYFQQFCMKPNIEFHKYFDKGAKSFGKRERIFYKEILLKKYC